MLDSGLEDRIKDRIQVEMADRAELLDKAYAQTVSDFVKAGALNSSRCAMAVAEVFGTELKSRAALATNILTQWCSDADVPPTREMQERAKEIVQSAIEEQFGGLTERLKGVAPLNGPRGGNFLTDDPYGHLVQGILHKARTIAISRANSEVERFITTLQRKSKSGPAHGNTVNIHGHSNVVQLGTFNQSPVNIEIGGAAKEEIEKALDQLASQLAESAGAAGIDKTELLEMVDLAKSELADPKPNIKIVTYTLMGLATAIQTTAALQPAWTTLQGALRILGIL
jgi:hypothetical protein